MVLMCPWVKGLCQFFTTQHSNSHRLKFSYGVITSIEVCRGLGLRD